MIFPQIYRKYANNHRYYLFFFYFFVHAFLFDKIRRKADRVVYMFTNDFRMFHLATLLQHLEK